MHSICGPLRRIEVTPRHFNGAYFEFILNGMHILPYRLCNQFVVVLGFDWFLLFLSPLVHDSSAGHALRAFGLTLLTFGTGAGGSVPPQTQKLLSGPEFESVNFMGPVAFRKDLLVGGWMCATSGHRGRRKSQMQRTGGLPFSRLSIFRNLSTSLLSRVCSIAFFLPFFLPSSLLSFEENVFLWCLHRSPCQQKHWLSR